MTATLTQARDEMQTVFRTAWLASAVSQSYPIQYADVSYDSTPTDVDAWARLTVQHGPSEQVTLVSDVGSRRFRRFGIITAQVFTKHGKGMSLSDQLAEIGRNAFEGVATTPGRVIFRNVRTNEVGQDGQWFQTNVLAEFEYDEVR